VCLDAPIVAVSWQWLFARSFGIAIPPGATAALFLTAWLIYIADRFDDSVFMEGRAATSSRQRFCLQHRVAWLGATAFVACADVFVISTQLNVRLLVLGAVIGACALVYLVTNQKLPRVWRLLPLKEVSIGFLFVAGTVAGLVDEMTSAMLASWLLFAGLCSLNCISIAVWERELDLAQRRVSLATAFPRSQRYLLPATLVLSAAAFAIAMSTHIGARVYLCVGVSGLLLASVHSFRRHIQSDARTALADLVLMTPLLAVFVA